MQKFYYCDKCGTINPSGCGVSIDECDFCKNFPMMEVPEKYSNLHWRIDDWDNRQLLDEEVIKKSPNLDPYLFEHRHEIIRAKIEDMEAKMAIGRAVLNGAKPKDALKGNFSSVKCPICGNQNVSKIGLINRAVSTGLFGLASSKIGKTHKCNNCGSTF